MSIVLNVLTFFLILVSVLLGLVVLAQKAKSDGGMGAAMGGGMVEATWGAESSNVLSRLTIYLTIGFFVLGFVLYLGRIWESKHTQSAGGALPTISAPAAPAKPVTLPLAPGAAKPGPATTVPATAPAAQPAPVAPASSATSQPASKKP